MYIPVFPRNCGFVIFDHFKHCQLPENEESINNMIIDLEIPLVYLFQMLKLSLMLVQHQNVWMVPARIFEQTTKEKENINNETHFDFIITS